jgi:hypothetical protein
VSIANNKKIIILLSAIFLAGFCIFPANAFADYENVGSFISTNIIPVAGASIIDSFAYTVTIPASSSASVQFSTDQSTWYNSAGTLNGIDALSDGTHQIELSARGWSGYAFYYKIIFSNSNVVVTPSLDSMTLGYFDINGVYNTYSTSGSFTSTNLLSANAVSINSFAYTLTSLPPNTTATIQFSKDNSAWYNSSAALNGSDALSTGTNTISLVSLAWSGSAFYYKVSFASSDGVSTPALDSITLNYTGPIAYYWYGGTGNWSDYANHWCTISSATCPSNKATLAPVAGDNVVLDANSGTGTVTVDSNVAMASFAHSQTGLTLAIGTYNFAISGDFTLTNGAVTIGASGSNGLTAVNLTIGAGGIVTANGTYYNQVTVSGTLNPDVTGTYTATGVYSRFPYYTKVVGGTTYYIWFFTGNGWLISTGPGTTNGYRWLSPGNGITQFTFAPYIAGGASGTATVANVTASGFIPSKVTISGNYDQSSITSKFLAYGSLITVNGNGTVTFDGTLDSAQMNAASLVLNGTNTLTYGNNSDNSANGFGYLTTGQSGNTTTLASYLAVVTQLSVGTGTLTGSSYSIQLKGSTPLNLNASATISLLRLKFWGANQTIPSLTNGYGCSIILENGSIVTQTGNVVLNSGKYLSIFTDGVTNQVATWKTDGYNLTVGDYIQIGAGNDSGLKKLDATRNGARTSTITVGGNWLNYGTGSAPSQFVADNSTVVFNKASGTQTLNSGGATGNFYNLTHSGAGTLQLATNNLVASGALLNSAGTLDPNAKNITTTGNLTISDGSLVTVAGLAGTTWTVGGNFSASGHAGALLTLNPASTWYLNVAGTAVASYVNAAYSNASGGTLISQTNSTDGGNNTHWNFDVTAPTTTATAAAGGSGYTFGAWTKQTSVSVTLSCADGSGVGCDSTNYPKYCVDTANTCNPVTAGTHYTAPVNISTEGVSYIRYYSADTVPNTEAVKSSAIWIDTTKPVTAVTGSFNNGQNYVFDDSWANNNVTVTLACADAGGSGCAATFYCAYTDLVPDCNYASYPAGGFTVSTEGVSYVNYYSADNATNSETPVTQLIKIDHNGPSVYAGVSEKKNAQFLQGAGQGVAVTAGSSPIVSYLWTMVSGPGTITFGSASVEYTTVSASAEGTYDIRLTVTNRADQIVYDDFILVWDTTNPVVNAGADKIKNALFAQTGSATDDSSGINAGSYQWSMVSGPAGGAITFGSATALTTTILPSVDGNYAIQFYSADLATNHSASTFNLTWDTTAPTVSAGAGQVKNALFTQTATASDLTSGIATGSYQWSMVSGPAGGTIAFGSANSLATTILPSVDGSYVIQFYSADNATNFNASTFNLLWDATNPITAADAGVYTFGNWSVNGVTVILTCGDGSGAGCLATLYCVDTDNICAPNLAYSTPVTISASGISHIRYYSTDTAGNAEITKSQTIKISASPIPAPPPPLRQGSSGQAPSANILDQLVSQLNSLRQQAQDLVNGQPKINYPPIAESVPVEPQVALQGLKTMTVNPLGGFALNHLGTNVAFFANKLPQLQGVLDSLNINTGKSSDIAKLTQTELYLPGLTQTILTPTEILKANQPAKTNQPPAVAVNPATQAELQAQNLQANAIAGVKGVPLANLSAEALAKIPTNLVFAGTSGGLINFSSTLTVDKQGIAEQKITTISGKPVELVIRPDNPASKVVGIITLKSLASAGGAANQNIFAKLFTAALTTVNTVPTTQSASVGLLVQKFEYSEVSPGVFKAEINAPTAEGNYEVTTVAEYKDTSLASTETNLILVVDPEGYVYKQTPAGKLRIENATVSIYWLNPDTKKYEIWQAEKFLQKNPILTNDTGKYSFMVPQGMYYLTASATDYYDFKGAPFSIKEDNGIRIDIELKTKSFLPDWFNWQIVIAGLLFIIMALLIIVILKFFKGRKIN